MQKKILIVYIVIIFCFTGLIGRLYQINFNGELTKVYSARHQYGVEVDKSRGYIYDRNLSPLVNEEYEYKCSINPTPESINVILKENAVNDRDKFIAKAKENQPFKIEVNTNKIYSPDINVHKTLKRYSENQPAPHIIGHLDYSGKGVMGIEQAFDSYLDGYSGTITDRYSVSFFKSDTNGNAITEKQGYNDKHGVVLTLDRDIQRITLNACQKKMTKGAAVVMDVNTGDILASVSLPEFNPNDMESALKNPNNPFYNRAFAPTNLGSAFKIVVAACALEKGIDFSRIYECKGYEKVGETLYHCQNIYGHGKLNMTEAMEKSCNPYFINLARETGVQNICHKAMQLGFGCSAEIMPNYFTSKGKLPSFTELENIGEATNFSFGQGTLTASPLQVCQMVSAVANGGKSVIPRLVEGFSDDGKTISEYTSINAGNQVIEDKIARKLRKLMISVVENGSGKNAKPKTGGAGGKTGSAQTGTFDENGKELVQAWFTGFYPAEKPQYAITIMAEGGDSGGKICAPVFKEICDNLTVVKAE